MKLFIDIIKDCWDAFGVKLSSVQLTQRFGVFMTKLETIPLCEFVLIAAW